MELQEEYNINREEYMNGDIPHDRFYCWIADSIHINTGDLPVTLDRIRESHDPNLNDIPLKLWDNRDWRVRGKAAQAGLRSWSLSDTVCTLKAYGKREAQKI